MSNPQINCTGWIPFVVLAAGVCTAVVRGFCGLFGLVFVSIARLAVMIPAGRAGI